MRVIQKIDPKDWKGEVDCATCISKLEIVLEDLTLHPGTNDGPHVGAATFSFSCPVCKSYNSVAQDTVPRNLHYAVKEASTGGGSLWGDH